MINVELSPTIFHPEIPIPRTRESVYIIDEVVLSLLHAEIKKRIMQKINTAKGLCILGFSGIKSMYNYIGHAH